MDFAYFTTMYAFEQHINVKTVRLTIRGIVQGVGFRPHVYRLAQECKLSGDITNTGDGVLLHLQGKRVEEFIRRLQDEAPPLVLITDLERVEVESERRDEFIILPSDGQIVTTALIPADTSICDDCTREMLDSRDRRYHYPFINCTNCGPRYTITSSIPYDRPQTSMREFPMCADCSREYSDPLDRRFHAQPNACAACGPRLLYRRCCGGMDSHEKIALRSCIEDLRNGGIVAIRGLGGYHLVVDACNDTAIGILRQRKHRYEKPLAVMLRNVETALRYCSLSDTEIAVLRSPQRPIVIAYRRETCAIAPSVSLNNPTIGIMLPYTPLHVLLMEEMDALVMTSANISEEPICTGVEEAERRLNGIADAYLHHDRDILQRCDDSVVRVIMDVARPVRRSRGYVPRPVLITASGPDVLAVGAELKNTFCILKGRAAVLSQHIGDMENLETLRFFEDALTHLLRVFDAVPSVIAHDLHPSYLSTTWAQHPIDTNLRAAFSALPRIGVQHHHAHLAACLAEHEYEQPAIGLILDGTGYGEDGTSWGGEFLLGDTREYTRLAHFLPMPMPGADTAIREPWRMAWSLLVLSGLNPDNDVSEFSNRRSDEEREAVSFALHSGVNTPRSTGCGRLFDGVASLIGLYDTARFEAQAAIALEYAAGNSLGDAYSFEILDGGSNEKGTPIQLSFLPMIRDIVTDMRAGNSFSRISSRFHGTVVEACARVVQLLAETTGVHTIALSGGAFQNALLFRSLVQRLSDEKFTILTHRQVPANDGGIALGQAVIARSQMKG